MRQCASPVCLDQEGAEVFGRDGCLDAVFAEHLGVLFGDQMDHIFRKDAADNVPVGAMADVAGGGGAEGGEGCSPDPGCCEHGFGLK